MYKIDKIKKENKRIKIIEKILSIIICIVLLPVVIFNFTLIIKSFINPNKTPEFLGYKTYVIMSGSMEPTIMTGDAIFVKKVTQSEIKENDVISFLQENTIITHRIVKIEEENGIKKYTTKGDNNNTEDREKVKFEQIEGKYQFKINNFGIVIKILKSKITLVSLILIMALIYMYKIRIENKSKERKAKREKYEKEREKIE